MAVIFKTFDLIEIDGIVAGNIVDVISNHGPRRAEVLAAYGLYVAALQTALSTELETANATITQLQSKIEYLESIKPFNDGLIKIEAFMERCKPYMARLMFAANDEIPANGFGDIVSILNAKSKIGEPVNLNSTMFAWAIGKIRTLGNVTEEEIATLTRPASREEAFIEVSVT